MSKGLLQRKMQVSHSDATPPPRALHTRAGLHDYSAINTRTHNCKHTISFRHDVICNVNSKASFCFHYKPIQTHGPSVFTVFVCYNVITGHHDGLVVSTVTSKQEGSSFKSPRFWSLHILPISVGFVQLPPTVQKHVCLVYQLSNVYGCQHCWFPAQKLSKT